MRISFEGTYEEYLKVFGKAAGREVIETSPAETSVVATSTPEEITIGAYGPAPKREPPFEMTRRISDKQRQQSWEAFCDFTKKWSENFRDNSKPQPDRVELMTQLGSGPHVIPIMVMSYELRSLQQLVLTAMDAVKVEGASLGFANEVASHMVQISHVGFPDIAGLYDYSSAWERELKGKGCSALMPTV